MFVSRHRSVEPIDERQKQELDQCEQYRHARHGCVKAKAPAISRPLIFVMAIAFTLASIASPSAASAATNAQPAKLVPRSATGCNYFVCISIQGSGLFVSQIDVYARGDETLPSGSVLAIVVNGSTALQGGVYGLSQPSSGIQVFYYQYFPNRARVCGEIAGLAWLPMRNCL